MADDLEFGEWVDQTSDGGYITVAKAEDVNNYDQILLVKTDSMGIKVWENKFGGLSNDDIPHEVHQTSDGGYILVGGTYSKGAGAMDVWLIKTDSLGNWVWDSTFGDTGWDEGYSVWQTTDGNLIDEEKMQDGNCRDPSMKIVLILASGMLLSCLIVYYYLLRPLEGAKLNMKVMPDLSGVSFDIKELKYRILNTTAENAKYLVKA